MKLFKFFAALALAWIPVGASASDLPARTAPIFSSVTVAPAFSWTGVYVGVNGGYAFNGRNTIDVAPELGAWDTRGAFVGLTVGGNVQLGRVVLGIEADGAFGGIRASRTIGGEVISLKPNVFGTARARVGYDFNGFMPYVTGGLYWQHAKLNAHDRFTNLSATDTAVGWTIGGGAEYALTNNWSVKGEYLYARTGKQNFTLQGFGLGVNSSQHILRAGVNYRL